LKKIIIIRERRISSSKLFVLAFLFITSCIILKAQEVESDPNDPDFVDTSQKIADTSVRKPFEFLLSGGLGLTTNSLWGDYNRLFRLGTSIIVGLEYTLNDHLGFQLSNYTWIAEYKDLKGSTLNLAPYHKIKNNLYTQSYLNGAFKLYIGARDSKLRGSISAGTILLSLPLHVEALNIGFELYYRISPNSRMSISRQYNYNYMGDEAPNYLFINYYRYLNF
jgi:hypothetical protein